MEHRTLQYLKWNRLNKIMDNLSQILQTVNTIVKQMKQALVERLQALDYQASVLTEVANSSLEALAVKFSYIYSNVGKLIKDPVSEGGLGYSNDEYEQVKGVLFGTAYARQLMQQFSQTPINNSNKTILKENSQLYYVPQLDYTQLTDGSNLFYNDRMLIACADIVMPNCTNISSIFQNCDFLQSIQKFEFCNTQPWSAANAFASCSLDTDFNELLSQGRKITAITPWTGEYDEYWDLSNCVNLSYAFAGIGCRNPIKTPYVELGNLYLPDVTNTTSMLETTSAGTRLKSTGNIFAPKSQMSQLTLWANADHGHLFFDVTPNVSTYSGFGWSSTLKSLKSVSGLCCNILGFRVLNTQIIVSMLDSLYGDITRDEEFKQYRDGHSVVSTLQSRIDKMDPPTIQFTCTAAVRTQLGITTIADWIQENYDSEKLDVVTQYWTITETIG